MKMKDKVRRKKISWLKELEKLGNPELNHEFIQRLSITFKHTHLSYNRCAYYVLKNHYHTTTIDELVSKLYSRPCDTCKSVVLGDKEYGLH